MLGRVSSGPEEGRLGGGPGCGYTARAIRGCDFVPIYI